MKLIKVAWNNGNEGYEHEDKEPCHKNNQITFGEHTDSCTLSKRAVLIIPISDAVHFSIKNFVPANAAISRVATREFIFSA